MDELEEKIERIKRQLDHEVKTWPEGHEGVQQSHNGIGTFAIYAHFLQQTRATLIPSCGRTPRHSSLQPATCEGAKTKNRSSRPR